MNNADYWRGRFSIMADAAQHKADRCVSELEEMYREAEKTVQDQLEVWYSRFATNNGLSLADARKMLTTGQMEEFRWTVDQYIQVGQSANLSPEWLKKLENASARFHVSRLEAVQIQIQQQMELLYGNQLDSIDSLLKDIVSNGYTRTAYEIQKGIGLGWDITALNQRKLETLLSKPWTTDGRTFRDRCWEGKAGLVSGVQTTLTQGLLRGDSSQKITDAVKRRFNVSRYQAGRLVHTETTYFNAASAHESYKELGVDKVEIIETLDSHTCELCGPLDGTVIPLSQYEPGVTVPPFHPNCRGTTAPAIDPDILGERAARDQDGKVYYVPSNMKFQDWKETFVQGGSKAGLTTAGIIAIVKGTATTVKEAEQEAHKYAKSVKFKGVTNVDSLNELNGTLQHLSETYPGQTLGEITVKVNRKGGTWASANFESLFPRSQFMNDPIGSTATAFGEGWGPRYQKLLERYKSELAHYIDIGASKSTIKGYEKAIKQVENCLKFTRHNVVYAGYEVQSVITHEYGHVLADQLAGQINHAMANGKFARISGNPLWEACQMIDATYRKAISSGDIYSISMYASKNSHEFFAETFTMYDFGVEQLPDYIVEMIEKVLSL